MSLIKKIQVLIIIMLLIVIGHNLYQNESSTGTDRTARLINNHRLATKQFFKAVESDRPQGDELGVAPTDYTVINPLLRDWKTVSRKKYVKVLGEMSDEQVNRVVGEFNVKGTEFLSAESKRDFLWCDPELVGDSIKPVRSMEHPCTEMGFKEDTGKRVALASFPGSGSTWSRTLLEDASGVFTGAIYCDKKLKGDGFIGEYITTGNVIAIKSHQHLVNLTSPDRKHSVSFDAVIFVIRNVFDAIVSERKRSISKNHTGGEMREEDYVRNPDWNKYAISSGSRYQRTVERWLHHLHIPAMVVRYEDLMKDVRTEIRRMLDFLEFPYTKERLDCVVNHQVQTFHRKHSHSFDPFTKKQRETLLSVMKSLEPLLNRYNTTYSDIYNFSE